LMSRIAGAVCADNAVEASRSAIDVSFIIGGWMLLDYAPMS
jgi:hypothetical protein